MSIRTAVDAALSGCEEDWRVNLARTLADALDEDPNASMARELRAVMHDIAESAEPKEAGVADELRRRRQARIADSAS